MPEAAAGAVLVKTVFTGTSQDRLVCDTTLRALPDVSWGLFFLGGGDVGLAMVTGLLRQTTRAI